MPASVSSHLPTTKAQEKFPFLGKEESKMLWLLTASNGNRLAKAKCIFSLAQVMIDSSEQV